jgi:hypothetical protein
MRAFLVLLNIDLITDIHGLGGHAMVTEHSPVQALAQVMHRQNDQGRMPEYTGRRLREFEQRMANG